MQTLLGGLVGKSGPEDIPTAIRCRVCGILLEDSDAEEEYRGMSDEMSSHAFNMACEQPTKYREGGRFVCKVFPNIDRLPDDELRQRIDTTASKQAKRGWLTRNDFPPGSPGFLLLQAKTLMSALERLPREESVARFPDVDLYDDRSALLAQGAAERASIDHRVRNDEAARVSHDRRNDVGVRM